MSKYGFLDFIKEFKKYSSEEMLDAIKIQREEQKDFDITVHSEECIRLGKVVLDNEFDEKEKRLVLENALGFVSAMLLTEDSFDSFLLSQLVVTSPGMQKALTLMFYYTLGLSNKEGI